jgi:CRISPR-associated protein Cmr2
VKILHFTLGPVQGFVAQSRRTRDLWAGSFLLSLLSGHAMKAVLDKGGSIAFPDVTHDKLLEAIRFQQGTPEIGSIPNRFKAIVPDDFDGSDCKQAVLTAWRRVADAVWKNYVSPVDGGGNDVQAIWDRQIENFWDMAWVIGDEEQNDSSWLDQRKNWRTYQPSHECGDHCTLMGDWQELSGFIRAQDSKKQDGFWKAMRDNLGGSLDLGDSERLCAIALIKRLYPLVAEQAIGWKLHVRNWPSTSYMAAIPWLSAADATPEAASYLATVERIRQASEGYKPFGEYNTTLGCLQNASKFAKLDGGYFHKSAVENKKTVSLPDEDARQRILEHLTKVNQAVGNAASSFYVLLLMDGDSLGKLLQNAGGNSVSQALATFTDGVGGIVRDHCGKTVYAGGDDVLALLPLDQALDAAQKLREHYLKAFEQNNLQNKSTISAAVIFAHYNQSFRAVLKEAHHQLDDVAKEQNGRDSIAVSVLTGSGRTVQWVSSWNEETSSKIITDLLSELAKKFESDYSSGFFYNIRERFELLTDESRQLIEGLEPLQLLTAEYQKNREKKAELKDAEERVGNLLRVCRTRKQGKEDLRSLHVDGALLVRFLAGKGKGVDA